MLSWFSISHRLLVDLPQGESSQWLCSVAFLISMLLIRRHAAMEMAKNGRTPFFGSEKDARVFPSAELWESVVRGQKVNTPLNCSYVHVMFYFQRASAICLHHIQNLLAFPPPVTQPNLVYHNPYFSHSDFGEYEGYIYTTEHRCWFLSYNPGTAILGVIRADLRLPVTGTLTANLPRLPRFTVGCAWKSWHA